MRLLTLDRIVMPEQRTADVTHRALIALRRQQHLQGPLACARRDFGIWIRNGATVRQAARVALAVFRAHS